MYSDVETMSSDERSRPKKTNKPMMEKKRRARINQCLSELKEILICDKHASAGHAKWEKADILEMTVDYIKKLRANNELPPYVSSNILPPEGPAKIKESRLSISTSPQNSPVPSPSSTESTSDAPQMKKRRNDFTAHQSPTNSISRNIAHPNPILPHPIPAPASLNPNFSFMTQQLLALQYQQSMKMAAVAPSLLPTIQLAKDNYIFNSRESPIRTDYVLTNHSVI
uniref:BHLH domain-containing protein n=1 Tax=Heterorhabditis bacteriophora TaxID=37862 RepID=A0A1I7XJT8_HETBA